MTQPPQYPYPPDPHSGPPHDPYGTPPPASGAPHQTPYDPYTPSSGAPYQGGPPQDPYAAPGAQAGPPPYDPNMPPSGPPPYQGQGPGFPPGQPFPPPAPSKKSNGPIIIGIAVGAVALVCVAAVFFAVVNFDGDDGSGSAGGGESSEEKTELDESITEEFDAENFTFWDTYDGIAQEKLAVEDGRFYPGEASDDARHTKPAGEPVFSDVDADGDLDAAMVLEDTGEIGEDRAYSSIHIWLWDDGEIIPVKEHASWQWECVDSPFEIAPGDGDEYFEISRDAYNFCEDPKSETITITVEDETPVQLVGDHKGAIEPCWVGNDTEHYADLAGISDPTLLPKSDSATLGNTSQQDKVEVSVDEWSGDSYGGHVIVVVTWDDGEITCGWVPWDEYKDNS